MTTSSVSGSNPYSNLLNASMTSTAATATTASTGTASSATAGSTQNLAQTFLQLLVAQMNNQDPLNPVDNNQLTTQMAQISTVTGINNLNATVTGLMSELQQSAALQSAQLTGHSVMVAGAGLGLASNTSASSGVSAVGAYSLGSAAANVTVTVSDAAGNTVRTLNLGAQPAGLQDFTWDGSTDAGGTAAAGSYTYSVTAATSSGSPVAATRYNLETVVGTVPQTNGSTMLMLGNGTQVSTASVAQII
jgi:flagellar basal-body rod modification protein FlgD